MTRNHLVIALAVLGLGIAPAVAQQTTGAQTTDAQTTEAQTTEAQTTEASQAVEPVDGITVLFPTGSARLNRDQDRLLDQAARLFRDGNPVVMVVTGTADTVGDPANNLDLSISRARAVADGLVSRGIPIDRLQVLGQGNSELPVKTEDEVSNEENRSAQITWR